MTPGRFVPADIIPAEERPDTDYPMVLITGRQLEHWHTGSMKIPEFKYCAVRVTLGGRPPTQSSFGGGQILASKAPAVETVSSSAVTLS